jgi:hypothetical protein
MFFTSMTCMDLLIRQLADSDKHFPQTVYNVGGGMENSVSLRELTDFCQRLLKKRIEIGRVVETRPAQAEYGS